MAKTGFVPSSAPQEGGFYETDAALSQYLLFHYGTPGQICPLDTGVPAQEAGQFPVRCVSQTVSVLPPGQRRRALDLGCAVGRSTFELARTFHRVVGIDFSHRFIGAAQQMGRDHKMPVSVPGEGVVNDQFEVGLPLDYSPLNPDGLDFRTGDACALDPTLGLFDFVLMANLIDRLPNPRSCLERIGAFLHPGGFLAISSPYTWLEEYTPKDQWLGDHLGTYTNLCSILSSQFRPAKRFDLPFLIREHRRKFQWSVAEISLWEKK